MKETITIPIKHKVFEKKNITNIASYIMSLDKSGKTVFSIRFMDDRIIEDFNLNVFKNPKFSENEIHDIQIEYLSADYNKRVKIIIYNYDIAGISKVELIANDDNWLRIVESKIREHLGYCKEAGIINKLYSYNAFVFLFPIIISFVLIGLLRLVFKIEGHLLFLVGFGMYIILTILLSFGDKIFPSVEILNSENSYASKKRKSIISFFSIAIAPLLFNTLYDIIKTFIVDNVSK